jgi:23S rRNA (adenine2503-C2)-methyltransferase
MRESALKPALALSLHTTDAGCVASSCRARRHRADELVELADEYARASGIPTQYQWTLLAASTTATTSSSASSG